MLVFSRFSTCIHFHILIINKNTWAIVVRRDLTWSPGSWTSKANPYPIVYDDETAAKAVISGLTELPPLVTLAEISVLKDQLKDVAQGIAFVLQAGDCAELFEYCNEVSITERIALLIRLGTILVGRMAGQYGKPRNSLTETINGAETLKFYGDIINDTEVNKRQPDPTRMRKSYARSSITISHMRSILTFDTEKLHEILCSPIRLHIRRAQRNGYNRILKRIDGALTTHKCPAGPLPPVFTSHEALFLHYEQAVTKMEGVRLGDPAPLKHRDRRDNKFCDVIHYNGSAHFVWIGDKTRQLDGAHVEYCRGLKNPVGVKLGPSMNPKELSNLLDVLNPDLEVGKVTLITRLGADRVSQRLPSLTRAVQQSNHSVAWQCDPMHGNTRTSAKGLRTRSFSAILSELVSTIEIHASHGSQLGGIHLETTSDEVVECVGGPEGWGDSDLGSAYKTRCDPRLNSTQAQALIGIAAERFCLMNENAKLASKI
ncbi:phospho-2-dehydro-3-deoxyheptonate aldolase, class II [Xylogone sp. PMI_703]|nr:phospho-2-dehydro-3-deoxyheptonate aldolase, class II [Xylogone sp. PMI_703]